MYTPPQQNLPSAALGSSSDQLAGGLFAVRDDDVPLRELYNANEPQDLESNDIADVILDPCTVSKGTVHNDPGATDQIMSDCKMDDALTLVPEAPD